MRDKLEKYDIQKLESYWFDYFDKKDGLKKQLYLRELELLIPFREEDTNGMIKGSRTSDLTSQKALAIAEDKKYQNLKLIYQSVEDIYKSLDDEAKKIVQSKYSERYHSWEDIGESLYMSKSKVLRIRNKILDLTAEFIGWV